MKGIRAALLVAVIASSLATLVGMGIRRARLGGIPSSAVPV
jgi:hypothetical protein